MELSMKLFGMSLGAPSPMLVSVALLFAIVAFAFAEYLAERHDDPRILMVAIAGMSLFVWLVDIAPVDGKPSFAAFMIETAVGSGLFGAVCALGLLVAHTRHRARGVPSSASSLFGAPRGL